MLHELVTKTNQLKSTVAQIQKNVAVMKAVLASNGTAGELKQEIACNVMQCNVITACAVAQSCCISDVC